MDEATREIRGDILQKPGGVWVAPVLPAPAMRYLCGLDLGQAQDYTTLVIVEQQGTPPLPPDARHVGVLGEREPKRTPQPPAPPPASYQVRHLERFPLGTAYPTVVATVQQRMQALGRGAVLVVDGTGVGRPVVDLLTVARFDPLAMSIHGGDQVSRDGRHYRVPKRDLVSVMQVLLQTQRLKIAEALPLAQVLVQALLNFRVTIDPRTAHDSYSAWREGIHDDLVLATALACWVGEGSPPCRVSARSEVS